MRKRTVLPLLAAGLLLIAAGPYEDEAGSSETQTVDRGCSEAPSEQYDPPSGDQSADCYDADGLFTPDGTYSATYFANELDCGDDHQLVPGTEAAGVYVSGNTDGSSGFLQTCSDGDLPIHGRVHLEGDPAAGNGTLSIDGDSSNQPEQLQGWAQVDLGNQAVSCGKSHSEGGRADSQNPTDEDGQEHCG